MYYKYCGYNKTNLLDNNYYNVIYYFTMALLTNTISITLGN